MNLSPPPGVFLPGVPDPSLEGVPGLEGDLLCVLEGVFLIKDSLNLLSPPPPPPPPPPLKLNFPLAFRLELEFSKAFLCLCHGALLIEESILVVARISFSREKRLIETGRDDHVGILF